MEWMSCGAEISNKFCTVECGMVDNIKHGLKLFGSSSGVCLSNPDLFWRVYSMADIQVCFCFFVRTTFCTQTFAYRFLVTEYVC
jgi:hypothetical protein